MQQSIPTVQEDELAHATGSTILPTAGTAGMSYIVRINRPSWLIKPKQLTKTNVVALLVARKSRKLQGHKEALVSQTQACLKRTYRRNIFKTYTHKNHGQESLLCQKHTRK